MEVNMWRFYPEGLMFRRIGRRAVLGDESPEESDHDYMVMADPDLPLTDSVRRVCDCLPFCTVETMWGPFEQGGASHIRYRVVSRDGNIDVIVVDRMEYIWTAKRYNAINRTEASRDRFRTLYACKGKLAAYNAFGLCQTPRDWRRVRTL